MADFTPSTIPLGSLADAAAASAEVSYQEQQLYAIEGPGPTTGIIAFPEPDWP